MKMKWLRKVPLQKLRCYRSSSKMYKKWEDYINWEKYYMSLAILASKRSKDPAFRVGAVIVNDTHQIVGIGYNGMPVIRKEKEESGGVQNDEKFPWEKVVGDIERNKHFYVCHAEMNAIAFKTSIDVTNCTMYVTLSPCNECAKLIAQSGIKKVIYLSDENAHKDEFKAGRKILDIVGVELKQYKEDICIVIDTQEIKNQAQNRT